ncbi:transcription factor IIIA isoform X2 [Carica papaya]|uniref:transcription factor IIIA isoform X2 n=1 Tax=Carica papaya TaxID=3649 RepID=UPI000B8CC163|nr:transcription factor IIIA isoform X2 [Carica papaya]
MEEMTQEGAVGGAEVEEVHSNTCQECGASFRKAAYLNKHMQSHSVERPFICSVDDCSASYRRKDHLTRHILQHQGKLFKCPVENCNLEFVFPSNIKRHTEKFHNDADNESPASSVGGQKQHVCQEVGCGKVFKFASQLQKHADSHVKPDSIEAFCAEPGCMKYFTNEQCLRAHVQTCHQKIDCEICGSKQLRKNMKRHLRTHDGGESSSTRIKCDFEGCHQTFSTKSNLSQHVKAVHLELKPFICSFSDCGMQFAYKHVRDNHEKTGCHLYTCGDFVESDVQFRSTPRGGRKREPITVDMLIRKRVMLPQLDPRMEQCDEQ